MFLSSDNCRGGWRRKFKISKIFRCQFPAYVRRPLSGLDHLHKIWLYAFIYCAWWARWACGASGWSAVSHMLCICEHLAHIFNFVFCICEHLAHIFNFVFCICEHLAHVFNFVFCICEHLAHIFNFVLCICEHLANIFNFVFCICWLLRWLCGLYTAEHLVGQTSHTCVVFEGRIFKGSTPGWILYFLFLDQDYIKTLLTHMLHFVFCCG